MAGIVLLFECVAAVAFAIYWKIKHPTPVVQKDLEINEAGSKNWGWAVGFIILMIIIGSSDDSSNNSTANTSSTEIPAQPTSYTYTPPATQKTFYTNSIANIRACESASCEVKSQLRINEPFVLSYSSLSEVPEWVPITYFQNGVSSSGFIHKSVLSDSFTQTYVPTYSDNYYEDSNYKYNYRTGYSGDYSYSYSVDGEGDSGYVYGDIDTNGKYGEGYIYNEDGEEVYVETEWTDYGVMEATDEDGNTYELEAN